jgi:branched-chain amino acid transport system permease protein
MKLKSFLPFLIAVVIVIGLQVTFTLTDTAFYLTQLTMAAYYTVVAIGLCMLMGYAGQISLGHAGLFAIGGYTSAVLSTLNLLPVKDNPVIALLMKIGLTISTKDLYGGSVMHLNPWLGLITAVLIAVAAALLIGIPSLRLKGHYLAMATLGFGTIIYRLVLGTKLTGEADGISDVPAFTIFPGLDVCGDRSFRVANYYIAWFCVLFAALLIHNLIHSRSGRALRSIHGNEEAASAMGVNVARYKLYIFILSAVLAAVAGSLLTHYNGGIGPSEAGVMKSVRYLAIVAVGGMANLWGTIAASVVLNFLSLRGYFGSYDDAVFGAILVIFMLIGNGGSIREFFNKIFRKREKKIRVKG